MTVAVREGVIRIPGSLRPDRYDRDGRVDSDASRRSGERAGSLLSSEIWPFLKLLVSLHPARPDCSSPSPSSSPAPRAALLVTAAPLIAAVPAFLLSPNRSISAIIAGGAMIVAGGIVLGGEHLRASFRRIGLVIALGAAALIGRCATTFARWARRRNCDVPASPQDRWCSLQRPLLLVYLLVTRRGATVAAVRRAAIPFLPAKLAHRCGPC